VKNYRDAILATEPVISVVPQFDIAVDPMTFDQKIHGIAGGQFQILNFPATNDISANVSFSGAHAFSLSADFPALIFLLTFSNSFLTDFTVSP
jgi:hypothetical protein